MRGSYFDGNIIGYIGIRLLGLVLIVISAGLAAPWAYCLNKQWELEHTVVNNRRLKFTGNGMDAVGSWVLILILTYLLILGGSWLTFELLQYNPTLQRLMSAIFLIGACIYIPFVRILILKWFAKHTVFDDRGPGGPVQEEGPAYIAPAPAVEKRSQSTSVNAPLAPIIWGILIGIAGVAVGILVHWAGFVLALAGLGLLIYGDSQQR